MKQIKIDSSFEGKVWISSDLHLLHRNIAGPERSQWQDGYRDFKDEYVMTDYLINVINEQVAEEDILINLGDFCFKDHKRIPELRSRIVCKTIHHILGNHDHKVPMYGMHFNSISDMMELNYHGNMFILCHYSMRIWPGSHKGYLHCYGHSHDSIDKYPNQPWGKSMDVGVDSAKRILGDYRPFEITEVIDILSKRDIAFVDHHTDQTNVH